MSDRGHNAPGGRQAPLDMSPEEFRALGHRLVDEIADFLGSLAQRLLTPGESPAQVRAALGGGSLPEEGTPADTLLAEASRLVFDHSLFNGHPRFMGYITGSPAPVGMLGELLASAANPNAGAWILSPMASEIEAQAIRWIAEMLNYPSSCGGLFVSGGNMANFVGFLAARKAKAPWDLRARGFMSEEARRLRVYCSRETHTWIEKAADLFGLGTDAIRWIDVEASLRIDMSKLRRQIDTDRRAGDLPFLVIGNAGTVSTGAVDPLSQMASLAREYDLWFHVDGAYGGVAAALPDAPAEVRGLAEADSLAVDPHKWLYAPLEAGCALVRDRHRLLDAFRYRPPYYHFEEGEGEVVNYFEHGLQNSRGFRALKVWLALRHAGRRGYVRMIGDDVRLARELYERVGQTAELEAVTLGLSIVTFRYVPPDLTRGEAEVEEYLNVLNRALLERMQRGGEAFVSNAVVAGAFVLRACIVNFRTGHADIEALPALTVRLGREVDRTLRPQEFKRQRATGR